MRGDGSKSNKRKVPTAKPKVSSTKPTTSIAPRNRYDDGQGDGEDDEEDEQPVSRTKKSSGESQQTEEVNIESTSETDIPVMSKEQAAEKERSHRANELRDAHRQGREDGIKSARDRAGRGNINARSTEYKRNTTFRMSKSPSKSRSRSPPPNMTEQEYKQYMENARDFEANSFRKKTRDKPTDQAPQRVAGVNGYFPDPIPLELSGINLLGEGSGYKSLEIWKAPEKFDNTKTTAVQWMNKLVESAQDIGMAHHIILHKLMTGSLLGNTAKLNQKSYKSAHPKAFKVAVTTPEEKGRMRRLL